MTRFNSAHTNAAYLPGVVLDDRLTATTDLAATVVGADIVLLVTPAQTTRAMMPLIQPHIQAGAALVICAKGLEQGTGQRLSDIVSAGLPGTPVAVLSGPGFALDVVRGLPTAVTLACRNEALGKMLSHALGYRNFRIYRSEDVTGVEIGGAVKNVLAIAAGILDGRKLGGERACSACHARVFGAATVCAGGRLG